MTVNATALTRYDLGKRIVISFDEVHSYPLAFSGSKYVGGILNAYGTDINGGVSLVIDHHHFGVHKSCEVIFYEDR